MTVVIECELCQNLWSTPYTNDYIWEKNCRILGATDPSFSYVLKQRTFEDDPLKKTVDWFGCVHWHLANELFDVSIYYILVDSCDHCKGQHTRMVWKWMLIVCYYCIVSHVEGHVVSSQLMQKISLKPLSVFIKSLVRITHHTWTLTYFFCEPPTSPISGSFTGTFGWRTRSQ